MSDQGDFNFNKRYYKQPAQPSLWKDSAKTRSSGLTPAEERELVIFCLAGETPRSHTVERTGTTYTIKSNEAAIRMLENLRFGTAADRKVWAADGTY